MTGALFSQEIGVGGSMLLLLLLLAVMGKREGQEARPETLLIPTAPLASAGASPDAGAPPVAAAAAAATGSIIIVCVRLV